MFGKIEAKAAFVVFMVAKKKAAGQPLLAMGLDFFELTAVPKINTLVSSSMHNVFPPDEWEVLKTQLARLKPVPMEIHLSGPCYLHAYGLMCDREGDDQTDLKVGFTYIYDNFKEPNKEEMLRIFTLDFPETEGWRNHMVATFDKPMTVGITNNFLN